MELQEAIVVKEESQAEEHASKPALTPPTSEDLDKKYDSSSELSELDLDDLEDDDDFEIEPDHYWGDGKIPIFKPVCASMLLHIFSSNLSFNILRYSRGEMPM